MRVLLLGAGRIGRLHAEHLDDDGRVAQLLISDPHPGRGPAVAERLSRRASAAADAASAISSGIDAVVIATPSTQHYSQVLECLKAQIPVFCEKPMAISLDEVRHLKAMTGGTPLVVGFQRRFDDSYRRLAEECASARARGLHPTVYRLSSADHAPPPLAFLRQAGSLFHDLLLHDFDVLSFLNPSAVLSVTGRGSAAGLPEGSPGWGAAAAICELADGSLGVITGSRRSGGGYEVSAQASGAAGTFAIGTASVGAPAVILDRPGLPHSEPHRDFRDRFRDAYRREIRAFIDIVQGKPVEAPGVAEMERALVSVEAATASALSDRLHQMRVRDELAFDARLGWSASSNPND